MRRRDCTASSYLFEKVVAVRTLVDVVQDGHLRANDLSAGANRGLQFNLDHVAGLETATFGHAVDKCLIEVENQRLLVGTDSGHA
jgi:hypothetical protein